MLLAWRHWRLLSTQVVLVSTVGFGTPSRSPSAVDITRRALLSPALDALQTLTFRRNKRRT